MFKKNMKAIAIGTAIAVTLSLSLLNAHTPESGIKDEDEKEITPDKNMQNPTPDENKQKSPETDDGEHSKIKTVAIAIIRWTVLILIISVLVIVVFDVIIGHHQPPCNTVLAWTKVVWPIIKGTGALLTLVCVLISYFLDNKMSERDTQKLEYYTAVSAFAMVMSEILQG